MISVLFLMRSLGDRKDLAQSWPWRLMSIISAPRKQKQVYLCELKASLVCIVSSGLDQVHNTMRPCHKERSD